MPSATKKFIYTLLFFFLILTIIALYQKLNPQPPKVLSTLPLNQSREVAINTQIEVVFDKTIKINDLKIELQPEFIYQFSSEKEKLILKPETPLNFDTLYTFKLTFLPVKKEIYQLSFQTLAPQGGYQAVEEIIKEQQEDYPLAPYSPPEGASFYFLYTGPKQIRVFLKRDSALAKKEFFDWADSLGIDLSDHFLEWK